MPQRLFIITFIFTFVLGAVLFVVSPDLSLAQNRRRNSSTPIITTSPSISPSIAPSSTSSPSSTPSPSLSPSPEISINPIGDRLRISQTSWKSKNTSLSPLTIEELSELAKDDQCGRKKDKYNFTYNAINYSNSKRLQTSDQRQEIRGPTSGKLENSYLISNVFKPHQGNSAQWYNLTVAYKRPLTGSAELYYRVFDGQGTVDPKAGDWVKLPEPVDLESRRCGRQDVKLASYSIDKTGQYFQYKIHLKSPSQKDRQIVYRIDFEVQPVEQSIIVPTPSPTPSPSPTPAAAGKISILTKKIILPASSPAPQVLLPTISPAVQTSPSAAPTPNPACFNNQNTEPAANVPFTLRQLEGEDDDRVKIEDQQTDEDGIWKGLDGQTDAFPIGSYQLKFGDFQSEDYKLIDICVTPDLPDHVRKTETGASANKATIMVKKDKETKITLLYGLRNKPYISMNKFALNTQNKIMKVVYPGTSLRYLIRYENTGESDALDTVIRDVVPEQYYVQGSDSQDIDSTGYTLTIDAFGRTTVEKKLGTVRRGQKGSLVVPVTLKPDAFGSVGDLADQAAAVRQQNQNNSENSFPNNSGNRPVGPADFQLD